MDPYLGYEIALVAILVYIAVVYGLWRTGRLGHDRMFSLLGPALMIKTGRGRSVLERWGRFVRFWTAASDLGIALAAAAMVIIVGLLVLGAVASVRLGPSAAANPATALGLPGINPIIPLGYGLVALVVGIVLHELSHGVVARSQKIGVKSLGILWCVIPVGAFVEQDDTQMASATRRHRDRVAAAGILANFALALVFFAALSVVVTGSVHANANGVGIAEVEPNTPAANASLVAGDIILSIDGNGTTTSAEFQAALQHSIPGEKVTVVYRTVAGATLSQQITLTKFPHDPSRGYLGVGVYGLTPVELQRTLAFPLTGPLGPVDGTIYWLVLPLAGLEPVGGTLPEFFHLSGPLAALGTGNFWIVVNLLYWMAWMNLLLGLSNALPLVPLDGGLLFRDFSMSILARFRRGWDAVRIEAAGGRAVAISSLAVLVLLLWQFVVPRLL